MRRSRGFAAGSAAGIVLALGGAGATATTAAAAGGADPTASAAAAKTVTLRHAPSDFRIKAPRGFKLEVRQGVYTLRKGATTMSFSRSITTVSAAEFGAALLRQLGGKVVSRAADARRFSARVDRGPERETIVVTRAGDRLAVTTSSSRRSRALSLATVRRVGASARGGIALRAGEAQTSIPLQAYRAPDGGATAMVPSDPSWTIRSSQGSIEGTSEQGAFIFGLSINIFLPESIPPNPPPELLVSPYLPASEALSRILPRLAPRVSDIRISSVIREPVLPTFTSSAMYLFDYKVDGKPWTGAATIATDDPSKYSNYVWNLYYSAIGVPAGTDAAVGVGLLRSWKSWDASGAIAERTRQARELMNETNEVWRKTNEFRARIADQQSRDVGCLLRGYYVIEDNARQYELPPLPCGEVYVKSP